MDIPDHVIKKSKEAIAALSKENEILRNSLIAVGKTLVHCQGVSPEQEAARRMAIPILETIIKNSVTDSILAAEGAKSDLDRAAQSQDYVLRFPEGERIYCNKSS
jgi:hypothetical protein